MRRKHLSDQASYRSWFWNRNKCGTIRGMIFRQLPGSRRHDMNRLKLAVAISTLALGAGIGWTLGIGERKVQANPKPQNAACVQDCKTKLDSCLSKIGPNTKTEMDYDKHARITTIPALSGVLHRRIEHSRSFQPTNCVPSHGWQLSPVAGPGKRRISNDAGVVTASTGKANYGWARSPRAWSATLP